MPNRTELEVIWAIANYWKHQEEWPICKETKGEHSRLVWDKTVMRRENEKNTVEIVMGMGMSPISTGNIRGALRAFGATDAYEDLSPIRGYLT